MYNEEVPDISEELAKAPTVRIVEELDCFTPRRVIRIKYSGPDIRKIVGQATPILQKAMRVGGTHVFTDDYYIDTTDPNNINFHIFWHLDKSFDGKTSMWCSVKLKHGLLKPDGSGSVEINLFPKLRTNWNKRTLLQRNPIYNLLIKIYKYIYYDEQRRKYLKLCRDLGEEAVGDFKELVKLTKTYEYA